MLGFVRIGPVVVCESVEAPAAYVQSHAVMVPGAVDVLPLKVHSRFLPPFMTTHVSDVSVPVTPKLAVATVGALTDSTTDADPPP